jgi:hypothetical protein
MNQIKCLIFASHFTEICDCLAPGYSQFTACVSSSANNICIRHIPQSASASTLPRKLLKGLETSK